MYPQVKITPSQTLAKRAESETAKRLFSFSVPMGPILDIGIDYYCYLRKENSPSTKYFGVQVRGTHHFGDHWGTSFKKETINCWLQQPFPVYLVVYDETSSNCYWLSIEDRRKSLIEKMKTCRKTIYIKIDKSNALGEKENQNEELIRKIEVDISLVNLIQGHPRPIGDGYVFAMPVIYVSDGVMERLKDNIRLSALQLINNYLLRSDIPNAYSLNDFLTKFDKSHYEHFLLFARINRGLGRKDEAVRNYEEAMNICKRDKNWNRLKKPFQPSIENIIDSIEREKAAPD